MEAIKEYAFDVKLDAVARVKATSKAEAIKQLHAVVDCVDLSGTPGTVDNHVTLTEATCNDDHKPILFEVDGEPAPFPSEAHYIAAAKANGWAPCDEDSAQEYCETEEIDASQYDPRDAR